MASVSSSKSEQLTEQHVISNYKQILSDCQAIRRKISELEQERSEHNTESIFIRLVIETLEGTEKSRRAFRLIGGILVERTVEQVLPSVKQNQDGISQVLKQLESDLNDKEKEANTWKEKYSIKTQREIESMASANSAKSSGLLA